MKTYIAFYRGKQGKIWPWKQAEIKAETSYDAQKLAVKLLKAKKSYEVTVVLADDQSDQNDDVKLLKETT